MLWNCPSLEYLQADLRRQISSRQAACLLMRILYDLAPDDEAFVQRLCDADAEIAVAHRPAKAFKQVMQQRQTEALPTWLPEAEASEVHKVKAFVAGIGRDHGASG